MIRIKGGVIKGVINRLSVNDLIITAFSKNGNWFFSLFLILLISIEIMELR